MNNDAQRRANQRKREIENRRNQRWADRTRNNHGHPEPGIGWVYVLLGITVTLLIANAWAMSQ